MPTILTGWTRGGDPPVSLQRTVPGDMDAGTDMAAQARATRALAYGTSGGIAPGMYAQSGSREVPDQDSEVFTVTAVARALAVDGNTAVGTQPFDGVVASVTYTPNDDITGVDTNSRTVNLVNVTNAGAVVATLDFVDGEDATADEPKVIPLSGDADDLVVDAGDVLQWQSIHVGTGLADPGGSVTVTTITT